jgi:hypothetical protein
MKTDSKGISQVLSLIIAAMVLMIAGLTVVFMTTGSIFGFGSATSSQQCTGAIEARCNMPGTSGSIDTPPSCDNVSTVTGDTVDCGSY